MSPRSSWHLRVHLPIAAWILIELVLVVAHRFIPAANWLMLHVLFLGIASNAILIWSTHFTEALLHARGRLRIAPQLALLNVGASAVIGGRWVDRPAAITVGSIIVAAALLLHAVLLASAVRRALTARFGAFVRYYVLASCFLPIGAALGGWMATEPIEPIASRAVVAHAIINVIGWIAITALATVVTLLPTMLRTKLPERAALIARRALPVIVGSTAVAAGFALAGIQAGTALSLVVAAVAIGALMLPLGTAVRAKPPTSYCTWASVLALCWLVISIVVLAVAVGSARTWPQAADRLGWVVTPFAVGFVAQLVTGALSYLLPVVLRGGPRVTRAMNHELDRGYGWRLVVLNLGLLLFSLPMTSMIRVVGSTLGLIGLLSFLPLAVRAVLMSRRGIERAADSAPAGRPVGAAAAGLVAVMLAVAGAVALDPAAVGGASSAASGVQATGNTTEVVVRAKDMRFTPGSTTVPAGDRLVLKVVNDDPSQVHDLVLETGHSSGRLAPGESSTIDVGVVGSSIEGWCSVIGHRQMGMVFSIKVAGAPVAAESSHSGHSAPEPADSSDSAADAIDLSLDPRSGFAAYDPTLPAAPANTTHKVTFTVEELATEVAPGVSQQLWTFNGTVPGPTLRGKVGDVFEVTLINHGQMGHSVDFHAGEVSPDANMRTIAPGESLVYTFTATHSGIWLYHCSTMPMSAHIASGMFGAVVIDPPNLAPVDHELLLVQSEYYLGQQDGPTDPRKIATMSPDLVTFNGYANQYDAKPVRVAVGQRVRIWVLTAGPNLGTSFHIVGGQLDTVYKEGAFVLTPGHGASQALDLAAAQGGFVELSFKEPGHYPFVNHVMTLAERGAHGHFEVTQP